MNLQLVAHRPQRHWYHEDAFAPECSANVEIFLLQMLHAARNRYQRAKRQVNESRDHLVLTHLAMSHDVTVCSRGETFGRIRGSV